VDFGPWRFKSSRRHTSNHAGQTARRPPAPPAGAFAEARDEATPGEAIVVLAAHPGLRAALAAEPQVRAGRGRWHPARRAVDDRHCGR
jgi:hypothetical protein